MVWRGLVAAVGKAKVAAEGRGSLEIGSESCSVTHLCKISRRSGPAPNTSWCSRRSNVDVQMAAMMQQLIGTDRRYKIVLETIDVDVFHPYLPWSLLRIEYDRRNRELGVYQMSWDYRLPYSNLITYYRILNNYPSQSWLVHLEIGQFSWH